MDENMPNRFTFTRIDQQRLLRAGLQSWNAERWDHHREALEDWQGWASQLALGNNYSYMYLFLCRGWNINIFPFLRKYIIQVINQSGIVIVAAQSHECKSSILLAMRTVKGKMI
jgi:hypothetical protein